MDSASSGSFRKRYSSALESAASTPSGEIDFSFNSIGPPSLIFEQLFRSRFSCIPDFSDQPKQRIVELIHHTFFQRNDCVIGDANCLGANLCAALRNIAQAQTEFVLEQAGAGEAV